MFDLESPSFSTIRLHYVFVNSIALSRGRIVVQFRYVRFLALTHATTSTRVIQGVSTPQQFLVASNSRLHHGHQILYRSNRNGIVAPISNVDLDRRGNERRKRANE